MHILLLVLKKNFKHLLIMYSNIQVEHFLFFSDRLVWLRN